MRSWVKRRWIFLLGVLVALGSAGVLVAPRVELPLARLPAGFRGYRIAQISDLHGRVTGGGNHRLLRALGRARPDLICITGDLFDEAADPAPVLELVARMVAIAPTAYVTGNHEWQMPHLGEILAQLEALGVLVLENEWVPLHRNGDTIYLAGVHDPCGPYDQPTPEEVLERLRAAHPGAFVVLLCHRNEPPSRWEQAGADLVLEGHCHGGVVRLPFLGGLLGPGRQWFPAYDAGLYRAGTTGVYVSRGLGGWRLFNPPHLPILVLQPGKT